MDQAEDFDIDWGAVPEATPDEVIYDDFVRAEAETKEQEEFDRPTVEPNRLETDVCPEGPKEVKLAVEKAHKNLGHPSTAALVRMFRLGGQAKKRSSMRRSISAQLA